MANTIAFTTTLTKTLIPAAIPAAETVLAPIPRFARATEIDKLIPMRQGSTPQVTVTPATLVNPTDWQSGDSTIAAVDFVPHELSQAFHVSNSEAQGSTTLEHLSRSNAAKFAQTILGRVLAILTAANYSTAVTTAAAAFGESDLDTLVSAVKSPRRCLLLETAYYARLRSLLTWNGSEWTLPGFAGGVFEVADWSTAGANVVGAVCDPDAVLVPWGRPIANMKPQPVTSVVSLPQIGLNPSANLWVVPGTRVYVGEL